MTTDPSEKPLSPWWRHAVADTVFLVVGVVPVVVAVAILLLGSRRSEGAAR
jgi:hypothetical protein